jgi:hypothetical protein
MSEETRQAIYALVSLGAVTLIASVLATIRVRYYLIFVGIYLLAWAQGWIR